MANRLPMAEVQAIVTLFVRGWSRRRIARELGVDRETVNRYVRAHRAASQGLPEGCGPNPAKVHTGAADVADASAEPNPAKVHTGSDQEEGANPAKVHTGSAALPEPAAVVRRQSDCAPFADLIQAKLDQGLSAQRIYQDLVAEAGFTKSYYSVLRYVRSLGPDGPAPFRRLEKHPGEEAQVDFGKGAWVRGPDGRRTRPHVFRIVLSHSRKGYSEAVPRQTTDAFLQCLENAFHAFGGVPQTVVLDNLKAAVARADWFDPALHPKIEAFAHHYGTVFLPTKPYTPRHKGKVERGIAYVQDNALKGRTFATLEDQNRHLREWEAAVADTRIHGTTRRQVGRVFHEVERAALTALPAERFPNFTEAQRTVHRDGHVEVERAYYSAPVEYVGRTIWARWDGRLVRLFNQRFELLATHVRHLPGSFSTQDPHVPVTKRSKVETNAKALLAQAQQLGPHTGVWAQAMLQERGIAGIRPLLGLLSLAKKHASERLDQACRSAHDHGAYRLRTLRHLLDRQPESVGDQPFLDDHPLIRPLALYDHLARAAAAVPAALQETC